MRFATSYGLFGLEQRGGMAASARLLHVYYGWQSRNNGKEVG